MPAAEHAAAPIAKPAYSYTTYSTERPKSPHALTVTPPTSSSTTLLGPVPRSTSLRSGRRALGLHPLSIYSVATSTSGGPPRASLAPSPRAPSFSMRSFVSDVKNSLTSDSASTKGVSGSTRGEESEQFVFVDGDGPVESGDQGMGDETFIELHPFDTSSVSSHQTHSSRIQQGQETPRTPAFPQIQVQRAQSDAGHVPFPSSASRAPSPLAHSASLPIPTPARGHTHSSHSASSSPHSLAGASPTDQHRRQHHRGRHQGGYTMSRTRHQILMMERTIANLPLPMFRLRRENGHQRKEKEGFGVFGGPPPPTRPIPSVPTGEPSGVNNYDSREEDQAVFIPGNSDDTKGPTDGIPGTADEVMDISSYYIDHGEDAEMDPTQQARLLSPTPPLVIDKRMIKLATLPPRISFHQDSLEDWSESLFSVIGGKGKRSSVLGSNHGDTASVKKERRSTIRPMSPMTSGSGSASTMAPSIPGISIGASVTLGPHARGTIVEESDEQEQAKETGGGEQVVDVDTTTTVEEEVKDPPTPLLDVSSVSPLGKDLDPLASTSSLPSESLRRASIDSLPPPPPPKSKPKPKPKPKPTPLALSPANTLAPPRTNIITGISGKSPVNSLFGAKPQPLPIPIPPSQIRAQLRPAPPKSPHPPPTLPLPPLRRTPSPNIQSQLPPVICPRKALKHDFSASHALPSDSRPNSSQTLHPVRAFPGDRDSDLSTITVTPATIATAKTEVVRTAIASVIDSDAVSLTPRRESVVSTADTESRILPDNEPETSGESPRTQEHREAPDDPMVPETSSVSLLRDGPQSKWPAPPPPPA
ncbi:hypothetical protein J3R82DRAFT_9125 [Butyriboletus roseoflavus]|nr:hypothetical protein J3R82DRAFT_9125 [Butyriboletus roseoflavus]